MAVNNAKNHEEQKTIRSQEPGNADVQMNFCMHENWPMPCMWGFNKWMNFDPLRRPQFSPWEEHLLSNLSGKERLLLVICCLIAFISLIVLCVAKGWAGSM